MSDETEVRYGPEGQVVIDHLDESDSPTVRRHAATFRQVRARLAAGREAEGERAAGRGYVDGTASDVGGDGLRVLGAGSAAKVAEVAASHGWRVVGRFASHRRESDGAPVDAAVVMCMAVEPDGSTVHRWAMGHWRTEAIAPPMKRRWKFAGATVRDPRRGIRSVGARELVTIVSGDHLSDE